MEQLRISGVIIFLGMFSITCKASEVHLYIRPSTSPESLSQCFHHPPCLTLGQFSENTTQYSDSNTSLILEFLPGNHNLSSSIFIRNITLLKLFSQFKDVNINCATLANFSLIKIATVEFTYLTFLGCGRSNNRWIIRHRGEVAILSIISSNLSLKECRFHRSKGVIITGHNCDIKIHKCEFIDSSKVLDAVDCSVSDTESYYHGNSGGSNSFYTLIHTDFVISIYWGHLNFSSCNIDHNYGQFLSAYEAVLIFHSCKLNKNRSTYCVFWVRHSTLTLESSLFYSNVGRYNAFIIHRCNVTMINSTILENEAHFGPVLEFSRSSLITIDDITIAGNIPRDNPISVSFEDCTLETGNTGELIFKNNQGFCLISNSEVSFGGISMFLNNSNSNVLLSTADFAIIYESGAITCTGSTVRFIDSVTFLDNYSRHNGGALSAVGSKIYIYKDITLANNQAQDNGGGIYLFVSHFICEISCNFSGNTAKLGHGGGIHAIDSIVFLSSEYTYCGSKKVSFIFNNNYGVRGGGIYFEANSELRGPKNNDQMYEIVFNNNDALMEGKAIYVDDSSYLATCNKHPAQCFLQTSPPTDSSQDKRINITGKINTATIFGGLLDRCIVNNAFSDKKSMKGIEYLKAVTRNKRVTQMIASNPIRVNYCNATKPDCQQKGQRILKCRIQKGKNLYVPITAVDQVSRSVNASISSNLTGFPDSYLGKNQTNQKILSKCTFLTFNVYSSNDNETLYVFLKNQCNRDKSKIVTVQITFDDCVCPVGFHVDENNKTSCECECDHKISPFKERCNLSVVVRNNRGQGWIRYDNSSGFLFHPFCPYDFCHPPDTTVSIDLHLPNGSDAQCALNRRSLLCGKCKPGYSLSLSSSRCVQCHEVSWPWALMIVTVKIIAGVVLVSVILILNLTVSIGTLNGLIFYANIFAADRSLFLSFSTPNFFTVFIAWLNLDLGFDICYFKGIDAYSKAWLNILFPTYVITVLLLIILISKYSSRFGEFIGRWNPVATLATLLLLSYTKLLRAIITALSFTIITYPTGQQKLVWLQDASVKFFGLKHFPLGLLAIAIIIVGLIYTVLLFSWQWILRLPNRQVFRWTRNTRLNLFIEANLAPYKAKYRYWYGLLLLVRMALYLGIATEKSHESVTIVLAIGLIAASILLLRTFLGNDIYRNQLTGYVNSSFYYNLLALSLARLYCQDSTSCQKKSSIISIALAFIFFVFILSYHILCALLEIRRFRRLIVSVKQMLNLRKLKIRLIDDPRFKNIQESEMQEVNVVIVPTSTEVTLSPCKDSSDDKRSDKSASRNSTDGECCSVVGEETGMDDSFDNENVCKQNTNKKDKRWTKSNTLQEPLLQDKQ